jgi:hypothetical protein
LVWQGTGGNGSPGGLVLKQAPLVQRRPGGQAQALSCADQMRGSAHEHAVAPAVALVESPPQGVQGA